MGTTAAGPPNVTEEGGSAWAADNARHVQSAVAIRCHRLGVAMHCDGCAAPVFFTVLNVLPALAVTSGRIATTEIGHTMQWWPAIRAMQGQRNNVS